MTINDLQLQELRRFAELGRLSATMIHEISSPLTAALIHLELSDHKSPAIQKAKRNMHVLRRYIEATKQQLSARNVVKIFAVQPLLQQIEWMLRPLAHQNHVSLDMPTRPLKIKLYGDPVKFQQIVSNLIVNAIQAYESNDWRQEEAVVRVNISTKEDWLIITVHDRGKGIPPDGLDIIFEPFYTTKADGNGIGIGLAIVKKYICEDFGGSIKVKSKASHGTYFTAKFALNTKN